MIYNWKQEVINTSSIQKILESWKSICKYLPFLVMILFSQVCQDFCRKPTSNHISRHQNISVGILKTSKWDSSHEIFLLYVVVLTDFTKYIC